MAAHLPEIGPDGLAREAPVIAYTEKIIEEEQLQLRKYINENYSIIRGVERELSNLTMEMKLTAGPKKAALELLRKKIESATEKIRISKHKEEKSRKVWEAASKVVKDEEAAKQKLCEDLNNLVQESSNAHFSRLEELKRRLEALNPVASVSLFKIVKIESFPNDAHDGKAAGVVQNGTALNASSVCQVLEPVEKVVRDAKVVGTNQQPGAEGGTRGKKKVHFQGMGTGLGGVPKGRGFSSTTGWTGAGFDVDGRP